MHNYGVNGIAKTWYGIYSVRKNYIEHTSYHVTNDIFSQRNFEHNQHMATCRISEIAIVQPVQYIPLACCT